MKVLLIKDVYKLGHAGDIKRVADGYGRNYLIPQRLAVLATPGAIKQAEHIRTAAAEQRAILNNEMAGLASKVEKITLMFSSKAGETGKLYGSITQQMIVDALNQRLGARLDRRQIEAEPIRTLGEHKVLVRLTVDIIPAVKVIVYRDGEMPVAPVEEEETPAVEAAPAEEVADEVVDAADETQSEASAE